MGPLELQRNTCESNNMDILRVREHVRHMWTRVPDAQELCHKSASHVDSTKWRIRAVNRKATARSGTRTRTYDMMTVAQEGPSGIKASGTRMTRTVLPGRHRTSGRVPLHLRSKQRRILKEASRCWEV